MAVERLTRALWRDEPAADPMLSDGPHGGAEGNSRLTAATGAVLFVVIAVEGVTLLQLRQLVSVHVFVGVLLVPLVLLKTATTGYRFGHYYTGDRAYTRKGAPPLILRVTGPLVVLSTLLLFGTGLALLPLGRVGGHDLRGIHQKAFIVWIALMGVHVVGHLQETVRLSAADWRRRGGAPPVDGARARAVALGVTLMVGLVLAIVSLGWVGDWSSVARFGHG
jgi:hypothetical protein